MQDLRVVTVEDGALVAVADDGSRYRVAVEDAVLAELRRARPSTGDAGRRISPKEVQSHIRAGMSAEDVATLTGAELGYVERFEGPVLAEREHIVRSALNVAVRTAGDADPDGGDSFGAVIRARLADGGAIDERWAAWKDAEAGWIVKLTFLAEQVEHDARWTFEPRTSVLSPHNAEAVALSQQGAVPASLIPRLRAVDRGVDRGADLAGQAETGRFDSGAFHIDQEALDRPLAPARRIEPAPMNQTADLLEALRRRRGEREAAVYEPEHPAGSAARDDAPKRGTVRIVEIPLAGMEDDADSAIDLLETVDAPEAESAQDPLPRSPRRSRAAMPSWDEIVFGARAGDDS